MRRAPEAAAVFFQVTLIRTSYFCIGYPCQCLAAVIIVVVIVIINYSLLYFPECYSRFYDLVFLGNDDLQVKMKHLRQSRVLESLRGGAPPPPFFPLHLHPFPPAFAARGLAI